MTNFERALEIIDRACADNATLDRKAFRNALVRTHAKDEACKLSEEYFRGFTQALYYAGAISFEDRDILRMAMYENIPEGVNV